MNWLNWPSGEAGNEAPGRFVSNALRSNAFPPLQKLYTSTLLCLQCNRSVIHLSLLHHLWPKAFLPISVLLFCSTMASISRARLQISKILFSASKVLFVKSPASKLAGRNQPFVPYIGCLLAIFSNWCVPFKLGLPVQCFWHW